MPSNIFSDLFNYLSSVFSHWQSWLSGGGFGGAAVIITFLVERIFDRKLRPKLFVGVFVIAFFVGSSFMAWRDEHNRVASISAEKDSKNGELSQCKGNLIVETGKAGFLDSQNKGQQALINNQLTALQTALTSQQQNQSKQQATLNSCVVDLGKANTPEPQKTTIGFSKAEFPEAPAAKHQILMFAFTNRVMPAPAKGEIACEQPFKFAALDLPGHSMISNGPRVNLYTFDFVVMSPQWTPTSPLVFMIFYDADNLGECGIRVQ